MGGGMPVKRATGDVTATFGAHRMSAYIADETTNFPWAHRPKACLNPVTLSLDSMQCYCELTP